MNPKSRGSYHAAGVSRPVCPDQMVRANCVSYASLALTTPSMFNESAADDETVANPLAWLGGIPDAECGKIR